MKPPRTWLIVTTVIFGCLGALGIMGALMSVFLFDAPGSDKIPAVWLLFWSLLTFPLVCVLAIASSWVAYALKQFVIARCVSLLPAINVMTGAAAMLWLELSNGGRLN